MQTKAREVQTYTPASTLPTESATALGSKCSPASVDGASRTAWKYYEHMRQQYVGERVAAWRDVPTGRCTATAKKDVKRANTDGHAHTMEKPWTLTKLQRGSGSGCGTNLGVALTNC